LTRSRPVGSTETGTLIGVIICKAELHAKSKLKRGYLAMLVVDKVYRKLRIGTKLAVIAINEMANLDCQEAVLETEITNKGALRLYERLGFIRLWIPEKEAPPAREEQNPSMLTNKE
jgi:peptide alpha-N-acetyltransferase